jgi:hypothetical protein
MRRLGPQPDADGYLACHDVGVNASQRSPSRCRCIVRDRLARRQRREDVAFAYALPHWQICSLILIDQLVSACDCAIRDVVRSAGDGWRCRTGASGCGGALLTKAECSGPPRHPLCDRPSLTLVRHCRGEAWSEKKKICTPASITIWPLSRGSLLAVAGSGLVLLRALLS